LADHPDRNRKQVHYVGDSRVRADRQKLYPLDYAKFPGNTEAFFPDFLLKEWMVGAVFLVGFMTLVMADRPELGEVANPINTGFVPFPDWYFLFLYQLLKYKWASGEHFILVGKVDLVVVGTVILPGIAFTALTLVPWLDRSQERQLLQRPTTNGIMMVALIAVIALTWAAEYEHTLQLESAVGQTPENTSVIAANELGYKLYQQNACIKCHGDQLQGVNGPSLLGVGNRMKGHRPITAEDIIGYIDQGKGAMPAGMFQGTEEQKKILAEWLMKQTQK
jgi:menaquinol-cytochrome c reductase cytochrome b/c subunit